MDSPARTMLTPQILDQVMFVPLLSISVGIFYFINNNPYHYQYHYRYSNLFLYRHNIFTYIQNMF
jgi:hypothetical protein